jgi:hypothetical protein
MKRAALVALLLVGAGCGSAKSGTGDAESTASTPSSTVVVCMGSGAGRLLTKADVDGDGTSDQVRLKQASGACPPALVAATHAAHSPLAGDLSSGEPPVSTAFAVDPGSGSQLVVTRADHPRGGYQLRVYAAGTDKLVELTSGGQPLLPFVATDVQEHPWSIDCSQDGLVFTEAVAHQPVGIVPAWDIEQTTYSLNGTTVTKDATTEVADNVLQQDLAAKYPDLVQHSSFESCRVS